MDIIEEDTEANTDTVTSGLVVVNLGDIIQVKAAPGLIVRENTEGYFSNDEPTSVTVTTRIIRLLEDGDLILVSSGDATVIA